MFEKKSDGALVYDSPQKVVEAARDDLCFKNLTSWSERVERYGRIILILIMIYGVYSAFSSASVTQIVEKGVYYKYTEEKKAFEFMVFFVVLLTYAFYAFVEYCLYHVIALLVSSLAQIVYNTKLSALSSLGNYRENYNANIEKARDVGKSKTALDQAGMNESQ